MPAKPSRSEIESSVASRPKKRARARSSKRSKAELQLDSMTARRRQVIGGDLSGISRRTRGGRLSGWRDFNYVNWIAGIIVVAILGVFFWPHDSSEIIREVNTAGDGQNLAAYEAEARIDDTPAPLESAFGRETDLSRADEFRIEDTQEKAIRSLLEAARANLSNNQLTLPSDDNAVDKFNRILAIDASNFAARQGLEEIRERFLERGLESIAGGAANAAQGFLSKLAAIDNLSEEHQELANALEDWRQQQRIETLLASAADAESEEQLILPARQNALYFYQQVLELDAQNDAALTGINGIADNYAALANRAVMGGQYEAATGYLATISVIDPRHPSISFLEALISKAEPIANASGRNNAANNAAASSQSQTPVRSNTPALEVAGNTSPASSAAQNSSIPTDNQVSAQRTPNQQAREQEAFDRQYLQRGLDAYYQGEYDAAVALLRPLADKGVSRAQLRIGYMYFLGRGFERNRSEADRIIRAALPAVQKFADEGRAWAQSDIGSLYEDGLVLPRDYGEAVYWYRSAAEQGYPGAQTNLGIMYARGLGVSENRATAVEWFQRAAKQGDNIAQRNLRALGVTP